MPTLSTTFNRTPLRIVFMGTPELARTCLEALIRVEQFQVIGVATQPDRPKGRDFKLQPSPVKELALTHQLPVLQPERAREPAFMEALRELRPDLIAVAAFGQLLPKAILDLPRLGCLNVHTSLLPKYRGAAPIQWAILNDESETGVTIMKMDAGMDSGPMLTQEKTAIGPEDTSHSLHDRLAVIGAELLVRTIPLYVEGKLELRPQPAEGITYAPKIKKEDGLIDWRQPARAIWNRVRGLIPWPGAFTTLPAAAEPQDGSTHASLLKIWQAEVVEGGGPAGEILEAEKQNLVVACGQQALRILNLQREGGKRLSAQQFLAGHHLRGGQHLGKVTGDG